MGDQGKMAGAAVVIAGSAAVLAAVRNAPIDLGDGVVLVVALGTLARAAIRAASDPDSERRRDS